MKQFNLFTNGIDDTEAKEDGYTKKIKAPIYEPKNVKPHILELYDYTQSMRLINIIKDSSVTDEEKKFLFEAAKRFTVFNYSKIADYYAHSDEEMQKLMEQLALVIVDFDKAIQHGFVKLSEEMTQQYIAENEG